MPQPEHTEAIEKRLWTVADSLRANSNYASNEYFLPVIMGLVFLRHTYSRYLDVKEIIHTSICQVTAPGKIALLEMFDFLSKAQQSFLCHQHSIYSSRA